MNKVVENGMVKVLYAPGWGGGFLTWGAPVEAIFDPKLIELVENNKIQESIDYITSTYPEAYTGDIEDLTVGLVPEGAEFMIDEYDGSESIVLKDQINWIKA